MKEKQWKKQNHGTIKPLERKIKVKDLLFYKNLSIRENFNFQLMKLLLNNFTNLEKWVEKRTNKNVMF